ncbi:MAG: 16S rRNA (cytosine(1402)-N(4))-methyltransferase RsmH [Thermomicrobiales bacterium]
MPVLLLEAVDSLQPKPGGTYVDGTFGAGGHSALLASKIGPDGTILAFDRDPGARTRLDELNATPDARLEFVQDRFATMADHVHGFGLDAVDGVLLDLGISSLQLDDPERGFSFLRDGPLDMRLDPTRGISAADLIAGASEQELSEILFSYGEERQARRIARAVVDAREGEPVRSTGDLASLVERTIGRPPGSRIHPATRTFQALRIAVNDELAELQQGLEAALEILAPGGRLVVISFHSLEDRIVKQFIAREVKGCICPPEQPICTCGREPTLQSVGRPVRPSPEEVDRNPRARSAIMRVAERLS